MTDETHQTAAEPERAVLVGADLSRALIPVEESLVELGRLASTAGLVTVGETTQPVRRIHPATFVGSGKVEQIATLVRAERADVVIFDDPLTPAQQRNLEKTLGCKVSTAARSSSTSSRSTPAASRASCRSSWRSSSTCCRG